MTSLAGFRILPVLMVVAAICVGIRFSQIYHRVTAETAQNEYARMEPAAGDDKPAAAPSQDALKSENDAPEKPVDPKEELKGKPGEVVDAASAPETPGKPAVEAPTLGAAAKKEDWKGADDLDDEYADVKMEMFADLSKRRKDLDSKEKELAMREALLKATQAELEQKTKELTTIKTDIEGLLKQQTAQEDQRITSLVKIYEGMKAKDAARIFDSLEMDVLLQVMTKMSERKSAPILAAMDPERARNVTIMLAEQNKLPDLPTLSSPQ